MIHLLKIISLIGLVLTLIPSLFVFAGVTTLDTCKTLMLAGTIIWFISAPGWMNKAD